MMKTLTSEKQVGFQNTIFLWNKNTICTMEVGIGSSTNSFVRSGRQRSVLCTDPQSRNLCDRFWPLTFVIHSSVFDHRQFCIWHIWPFIGRFCTFGSQISLIVLSQVNKVGDKRSAYIEFYAEFFNLPRILHIHVHTYTHTQEIDLRCRI